MSYRLMTFAELQAWLAANGAALIVPVGALALVALTILIRRAVKRGKADALATGFAVAIATAFSAEGMYEVATERLHLTHILSLGLFAVAEAAMLSSAVRAKRMHAAHGTLGIHGRAVWVIAVCAGVIVSLNAKSVVEFPIRLLMPILVASLWWLGYQTDATRARVASAISWVISPRRVLVWLRLAEPGDVTVTEAARARLVAQMTATGFRAVSGGRLAARHVRRLKRLALRADDATVTEAAARIARADAIVALLTPGVNALAPEVPAPTATPTPEVTPETVAETPEATPETAPTPAIAATLTAIDYALAATRAGRGGAETPEDATPEWAVTGVRIPPAPHTPEIVAGIVASLKAERPSRTQQQCAEILGYSRRTLRGYLTRAAAATQGEPAPVAA